VFLPEWLGRYVIVGTDLLGASEEILDSRLLLLLHMHLHLFI
jgi:hypothetical protein